MFEQIGIIIILQSLVLLFGISIGRSVLILKLRQEENKKRSLELAILEKRSEVLSRGKQIAHDLEDVLYKAKVQQEIDDIIRKDE